jgi:hypothetical protein
MTPTRRNGSYGPRLPTTAMQQSGSYLRYTVRHLSDEQNWSKLSDCCPRTEVQTSSTGIPKHQPVLLSPRSTAT